MSKIPQHVAIILDGNRRYARQRGMPAILGHQQGAKNVGRLMKWAQELGIKQLTLYAFSTENFKRTQKEKEYLFKLFEKMIDRILKDKKLEKNNVKVTVIGKISMFPKPIQDKMRLLMRKTAKYKGLKVNMAMAYGGRAEIVEAVKKIIGKKTGKAKITEDLISQNLYLSDEPDLLIRTGGEHRISNFLIWQSSYAEFWFTKKLWPAFTKRDLQKAISVFQKRERRYGT